MPDGRARDSAGKRFYEVAGPIAVTGFAGERSQSYEVRNLDGVCIRHGVVGGALQPNDNVVGIIGGREVPAAGVVPIMPVEDVRPPHGVVEIGVRSSCRE